MSKPGRPPKRSTTDPETGLHNSLSLRLELERMQARAGRYGFRLGLITVTFPDSSLPGMAALGRHLAQGIRGADCLARTGPCELRMLLSHEDVEHAPRVMERLRLLVAEHAAGSDDLGRVTPDFSLDTALDVETFTEALAAV
jgi:GGDEF domain-containing protein